MCHRTAYYSRFSAVLRNCYGKTRSQPGLLMRTICTNMSFLVPDYTIDRLYIICQFVNGHSHKTKTIAMKTPTSFGLYFFPFLIATSLFLLGFFYIPEVGVSLATVYLIATVVVGFISFSRVKKRYASVEKIVEVENAGRLYLLTIVFLTLFINGLGFILWRTDPLWVKLSFIQDEANFVFVIVMTLIMFLLFLAGLNVSYRSYKAL